MGMNYYLFKKANYEECVNSTFGGTIDDNDVTFDDAGNYVYRDKTYKNVDELNKDYYHIFHIGKSSYGWHFALCIYPEVGINTLDDWKKLFNDSSTIIKDEDDDEVTAEYMINKIENRYQKEFKDGMNQDYFEKISLDNVNKFNASMGHRTYKTYEEYMEVNNAHRGKNFLWAREEDEYTKNTDGTYDYIKGVDFC